MSCQWLTWIRRFRRVVDISPSVGMCIQLPRRGAGIKPFVLSKDRILVEDPILVDSHNPYSDGLCTHDFVSASFPDSFSTNHERLPPSAVA